MSSSPPLTVLELLAHLAAAAQRDYELPDEGSPVGRLTREFFANNWANTEPVFAHSTQLRVRPEPPQSRAPHVFRFEIARPYKRRRGPQAEVELAPGPIRGTLRYRPDVLACDSALPSVWVTLDRDLAFFHPNFAPSLSALCLGDLPGGPLPLDLVLEHVYRVLTYHHMSVSDAADVEAAHYFAYDPHALEGLPPVEPLY